MFFAKSYNLKIVFLILAVSSFGLIAIFAQNSHLAFQQLLFIFLGLLFFFALGSVDIRILKNATFVPWLVGLVLVFGVTFFGPEVREASRWIELGFFRFQPTELAKPIVILVLSQILVQKNRQENFIKSLGTVAPFAILSFLQPDLGNAIIFLLIWYLALFISGFSLKVLTVVAFLFLASLPILFLSLAPYQQARLETFLNPEGDPLGAGYSVIQSQIAVGAGKIFGQGLLGATQSRLEFLPEAPTDFIFASIAESLGFVGSLIFISLFSALIYQLVSESGVADRFSQILILQAAGLLFLQFFINLAMSIGLLPVVGVTLPFVSYGGSSLISSFILLGLVQSQIKFAPKISKFE